MTFLIWLFQYFHGKIFASFPLFISRVDVYTPSSSRKISWKFSSRKSLVSTKKSYEDFEIVDIQFVVSKFGTQRFDFIFAVCIRLFEKFSQSKKSLYSATYWISSIIPRVSMVQVNWIYLIFNHVPFLVDSSARKYQNNFDQLLKQIDASWLRNINSAISSGCS